MELYYEIRRKVVPLADLRVWVKAAPKLQPVVTMGVLAVYCSVLHLLRDAMEGAHLRQAIVLQHLSGNVTEGKEATSDGLFTAVEEFLNSTYQENAGLSWKSVLEAPALRQIVLIDKPCFIRNAPKESCNPVLVRREDVNTTCIRCWTTHTEHTHICAQPDPEHDGGSGICDKDCEHGFGYCRKLGDAVWVKGYFYPEGGQGLYLVLDADRSYRDDLKRLRNLQWLTPNSRYVSLSLATLSDIDMVARVRLHFIKFVTGGWTITYDISLGRYPNYFPTLYDDDKPLSKKMSKKCEKVLHYFVRGPRDEHFRITMQYLLLLPLVVLLPLTIVETPYFWRIFTTTRKPTREDQTVLVINLATLALYAGVIAVLFTAHVGFMKVICDEYQNHSKLKWMEALANDLLLCLVLLWFIKLFCTQVGPFEPLTQCLRLARGGSAALLMVPFFLLPLIVFAAGVVVMGFADPSTMNLRQSVVTVSWAVLGQARLEEEWPVLMVVRFVALLILLPLAVVMASVAMSYTLVAATDAHKKKSNAERTLAVPMPL